MVEKKQTTEDSKISALKRRIAASKLALAAQANKPIQSTRSTPTKGSGQNSATVTSNLNTSNTSTINKKDKSVVSFDATAGASVKNAPGTNALSFIQRAQSAAAIAAAAENSEGGLDVAYESKVVVPAQPISPPRRLVQGAVRARAVVASPVTPATTTTTSSTSQTSGGAAKATPTPPSGSKPAKTRTSVLTSINKTASKV